MADNKINVGGRLHSIATGNILAGADEILDDSKGKKQSEINVDIDTALANRYTKDETYNKNELNSLITTPNVQYVTVSTYSQLPATGSADTIYKVSSYDGTAIDATKYAEYAWDGNSYVLLSVKSAVDEIFDISVFNAESGIAKKYGTLTAALTDIPSNRHKGGMSIKFVQSSDHKYVQFRYMGTAVDGNPNPFLDTANWQGVDDAPTAGSENLVKSGGVYDEARSIVDSENIRDKDLVVSDNEGYAIIIFKGGHFKTKEFDSSQVVEKLVTIERGAEVNDVETNESTSDFEITDENNNALLILNRGVLRTKDFNSSDLKSDEALHSDFEISDKMDNRVVVFKNGHIKTKNFNSKTVVDDVESLKIGKVNGRNVVILSSVFIAVPDVMEEGDVCFVGGAATGGAFKKMRSGILDTDATLDAYYKENSSTLIFYNKMDTMYYLYQNNTMVLYCNKVPRVSFTLDDTMYDCEAPESWAASDFMNIIYTKFDTLLQSAPSPSDLNVNCRLSVSKVDMVDFLNQNTNTEWSYPEYNDGGKSNMYIISNEQSFRAGYNLGFENQKHRLLLIGGVHGNERLGQYNTYLFAKNLLTHYTDNQNLYNLLLTFDIYIIPVLCVYGSKNGTRWNGNGVNIERNFPEEWSYDESVNPFTNNYMGTSAASEFETQAIISLVDVIKPNIIIDHHSYYQENQNLYCYSPSIVFTNAVFKIGCNLGRLLNRDYSQYYGNGVWYPTNGATTNVTNGLKGASPLHFYETKKIMASGIMEIAEGISFIEGEYSTAEGEATHLNSDVLKIAEYTLRNCVENLAEWVLNNSN